jgi:hypothetical protein
LIISQLTGDYRLSGEAKILSKVNTGWIFWFCIFVCFAQFDLQIDLLQISQCFLFSIYKRKNLKEFFQEA